MRRSRPSLAVRAALLAAVLLSASTQVATAQEPRPSDTRRAPSEPDIAERTDPAVLSLVAEGLATDEAISQMQVQVHAGRADRDLPDRLREFYGGLSIDHADGASVMVGMTKMELASEVSEHFASYGVRIEVEQHQLTQVVLEDRSEELQQQVIGDESIEIGIGEIGVITIRYVEGKLTEEAKSVLIAAADDPDLFMVERVASVAPASEELCDWTGDIECDPPLRGSVRMNHPQTGPDPICSAGFNAEGRTNGLPFVLSAGHCAEAINNWSTQFEDESSHVIGSFVNSIDNFGTDAGIILVNNPAPFPVGWSFGQPWVTVHPTPPHPANESYVITDVVDAAFGMRVCATLGNQARTDCGTVDNTNFMGEDTGDLFRVTGICSRGGDSGSPYFSFNVAYGIHVAGDGYNGTNPTLCLWGAAEDDVEASGSMNVDIITN